MRSFSICVVLGCTEYNVKGPPPDRAESVLDSDGCAPCDLDPLVAWVGEVDALCNHPAEVIADPYDIVVKRQVVLDETWSASSVDLTSVLVVDTNGDGLPELIAGDCHLSPSVLCEVVAYEWDGAEQWRVPAAAQGAPYAAANVDGQAGAEVILGACEDATEPCTEPVFEAVRFDGASAWSRENYDGFGWMISDLSFKIADLDADGVPEIVHDGLIVDARTGLRSGAYTSNEGQNLAVADVDHDGISEFADGATLINPDGTVRWTLDGLMPYASAHALDADGDGAPDLLFNAEGFALASATGAVSSLVELETSNADYASLADFDGDGSPELALAAEHELMVYRLDGELLWDRIDIGYVGPMFGWDFDADGASELIVVGDGVLRIFSGGDGSLLWSTPHESSGHQSPIVADIDGDGHAELIVLGGAEEEGWIPTATIFHQANDTWPAAGPSWPHRDFHISDIGPAGEIPRGETDPPAWSYNVFHARPAMDGQGVNLTPTLVDACSDLCGEDGNLQVEFTVANSGPRPASDVVVHVVVGATVVATATIARVGPGEISAGILVDVPAATFENGDVRVVVDPEDAFPECDEADNEVFLPDPR